LRVLPKLLPSDFPRPEDIHLNGVVIAAALALAALTALITGLLPSRMAHRTNLSAVMLEDGAPVGHGLRSSSGRSRSALVAVQVAIAMLLLVGAALLGRSFSEMLRMDRGFSASNVMTARVTLPRSRSAPEARRAFFDTLLARVQQIGSVTHAGSTSALPLSGSVNLTGFDTPDPSGGRIMINGSVQTVSRDYFAAMGMRIRDGRGFTADDRAGAEPVVVVSEAFVHAYPSIANVGATLQTGLGGDDDKRLWRIVGVTDDLRAGRAGDPPAPELFVLADQKNTDATQYIVARANSDPGAVVSTFRSIVHDLEPHAVIDNELTMEARVMQTLTRPRLYAVLLGGFAVFALAIAGIGLFGGLSYGISQRTREIGVRAALGASPGQIVRLVVMQGLVITAVGLVIGAAAAYASTQYLTSFLFGVTAHDARSFAAVGVLLLAIAGLACIVPARRAAKIDPLIAMKR
jgi:putative ABC transport system permease protein